MTARTERQTIGKGRGQKATSGETRRRRVNPDDAGTGSNASQAQG